ncbi:MAG: TonB family protein [Bacteroidales bacterium]
MKTTMFFLAAMLIAVNSFGQRSSHNPGIADQPVLKNETLNHYLSENIDYPAVSKNQEVQGTVIIGFYVNPDGSLTDYTIINRVSQELDFEVLRAIKQSEGKWEPGRLNGQPVKMKKEVSVMFKLYPTNEYSQLAKSYFERANKFLFEKENPEKALKFYNLACSLMPYDVSLINSRILCKARMGDDQAVTEDLERLVAIQERAESKIQGEELVVR